MALERETKMKMLLLVLLDKRSQLTLKLPLLRPSFLRSLAIRVNRCAKQQSHVFASLGFHAGYFCAQVRLGAKTKKMDPAVAGSAVGFTKVPGAQAVRVKMVVTPALLRIRGEGGVVTRRLELF